MVPVCLNNYVVVVLHVKGTKASDIELVLQREPSTRKAWFHACTFLPNEEHVNAAVCELFEEIGLTLTVDDLTILSGTFVRVQAIENRN
jgi:8-oxo-dGTP pyrophosphatase MutT (NUDIX family)